MQVNPKLIKKHFEKSFDTYNKNAIVQKIMAEKLIENLSNIRTEFDNILELGSGTGLLTSDLVKKISFKKYFANDLIEKSKFYINKIIPDTVFYCGNAQRITPSQKMDLIISNAMFQWFENLEKVCINYKRFLKKDGILAFSTFSPENFKEIRNLTGFSLDYKSLEEIKNILKKEFEIVYTEEFSTTLKFTNPLELLAHIKKTGVNSLTTQYWTFKEVKNFCDRYKDQYPDIPLTYCPIIVICKKI